MWYWFVTILNWKWTVELNIDSEYSLNDHCCDTPGEYRGRVTGVVRVSQLWLHLCDNVCVWQMWLLSSMSLTVAPEVWPLWKVVFLTQVLDQMENMWAEVWGRSGVGWQWFVYVYDQNNGEYMSGCLGETRGWVTMVCVCVWSDGEYVSGGVGLGGDLGLGGERIQLRISVMLRCAAPTHHGIWPENNCQWTIATKNKPTLPLDRIWIIVTRKSTETLLVITNTFWPHCRHHRCAGGEKKTFLNQLAMAEIIELGNEIHLHLGWYRTASNW